MKYTELRCVRWVVLCVVTAVIAINPFQSDIFLIAFPKKNIYTHIMALYTRAGASLSDPPPQ